MSTELAATISRGEIDFRNFDIDTPVSIDATDSSVILTVRTVQRFLCPAAPLIDCLRFLMTCKQARLNPLLGEAHLILMGKKDPKWQVVIAKSGYLKHAVGNSCYAGHESGIVVGHSKGISELPGTIMPPGAILLGGWCKVWRKGVDRPIYRRISMQEYDKGAGTWLTIACTMIEKCAVAATFRDAFGVGGYEEAEVDLAPMSLTRVSINGSATISDQPAISSDDHNEDEPQQTEQQEEGYSAADEEEPWVSDILVLLANLGASQEEVNAIVERRGVHKISELSPRQARELLDALTARWNENQREEFVERVADAPAEVKLPDAPVVPATSLVELIVAPEEAFVGPVDPSIDFIQAPKAPQETVPVADFVIPDAPREEPKKDESITEVAAPKGKRSRKNEPVPEEPKPEISEPQPAQR